MVNLFPQTAEPILLDQHKYEYPMCRTSGGPHATEIFSVDQVVSTDAHDAPDLTYAPFYCYRHASAEKSPANVSGSPTAGTSNRPDDEGTDIYLSLVDRSMRPMLPEADTLTVRATCTNRNLPARLPFGSEDGDFELEGNAPVSASWRSASPPSRAAAARQNGALAPDLAPVAELFVAGRMKAARPCSRSCGSTISPIRRRRRR